MVVAVAVVVTMYKQTRLYGKVLLWPADVCMAWF